MMDFLVTRVKDQTSTILESTFIQKENPSLGYFSSCSAGDNCMSLNINNFFQKYLPGMFLSLSPLNYLTPIFQRFWLLEE